MYVMALLRRGTSAKQVESETGISHKTAWRISNESVPWWETAVPTAEMEVEGGDRDEEFTNAFH
jgi:hypothetical protein